MATRLGRYDILRTLFKGELTDLLLARADGMEGFKRHVAIKRLHLAHAKDRACLDAFVNEARLAAALHHHNIVQVLDIGEHEGQPYFAMEYVHGVDLRGLLNKLSKRGEQLPLQHVVAIIAAAAAALHHAHEQKGPDGKPLGIVHRDVTPGNILVGFDGNVKVVDFGIAKAAIKRIITDQGVLKGRVPYMAPEQCAGKPVDRRSDVFALGIVAYELATVRRLFKGASEFLTMSAIVNAEIPKPSQFRSDVPPELEQIMLKALARDPAGRYQSAGEMAMALDSVAVKVGVGASTTQLANYMRLQFGETKEPWLVDSSVEIDAETTDVDFDGEAAGLAPPAAESVKNNAIPRSIAATRSSPIAQVRNIITPPKATDSVEPAKASAKATLPAPKKPVPMDTSYSLATEVEAVSYDHQLEDEPTDPVDPPIPPPKPEAPSLPPPPAHARPAATDATEIVIPLPPMPTERPVYKRAPSNIIPAAVRASSKRLVYVAAVVAIVVIVAAAVVLWPSSDVATSAAPEKTAHVEPATHATSEAPKQEPTTPEEPIERPSALDNTMADYHAARGSAREEQQTDESKVEEKKLDEPKLEEPTLEDKKLDEPKLEDKKLEDKKLEDKKLEDKKLEDKKVEDKKVEDKKLEAKKLEAKTLEAKTLEAKKLDDTMADAKPAAAKIAKRAPKTTAKLATKRAPPKTTKKTAKTTKKTTKKETWNPDELFLGD